jgi:hypothetical protein
MNEAALAARRSDLADGVVRPLASTSATVTSAFARARDRCSTPDAGSGRRLSTVGPALLRATVALGKSLSFDTIGNACSCPVDPQGRRPGEACEAGRLTGRGRWTCAGAPGSCCWPRPRRADPSVDGLRRDNPRDLRRGAHGRVTCSCPSPARRRTVAASRRCFSATVSTIWAISGQAHPSSSPSSTGLTPTCPEQPTASAVPTSRTVRRSRRMPVRRSDPPIHRYARRSRHCC